MKITELQLETHRLAAMQKFYTDTLELPLVYANDRSFTVQAGSTRLKFYRVKHEEPFYHFAFNIPENQFKEAKEWLASRMSLIEKDGQNEFRLEKWNADAVYFLDPAGNILEFIARHNLRNGSAKPFSSESIYCISEIGYPVEDVKLFCQHLKTELKLKLWDGDEKNFAALGDEEGLVIVVPVGRHWFPTSKKAESFQVTMR